MTNKIQNEMDRIVDMLPTINPTSPDYMALLTCLDRMCMLKHEVSYVPDPVPAPTMQPANENPLPWEEPLPPMQLPKEEAKSILPKEEPIIIEHVDEVLSADTVRARLQGASEKGVHIQPIIAKHVPEGKPVKFSSVPASEYTALVKELYDAQNK